MTIKVSPWQICQHCSQSTKYFIQVIPNDITSEMIPELWCLGCIYRAGKLERECQIEEAKAWSEEHRYD